jgi:methylglutamate dehydrogenase subunit D
MAEATLVPRSPLHGLASPGRIGSSDGAAGVTIREIVNIQAVSVIARKGRGADVVRSLSGLAGAEVVDRSMRIGTEGVAVTGVAPGQWLVTRRGLAAGDLAQELARVLPESASLTDQSHSRLILEIAGPQARAALAKGVPVDLDPSVFKVGQATQTAAGHINLHVALIDPAPVFEMITAASTAGSFWSWLTSSAAEYGIDVLSSA